MCDIVQDIDEALAAKGEGDADKVAEEKRKILRAEKVRLLVLRAPLKVEFYAGGLTAVGCATRCAFRVSRQISCAAWPAR